MSEGASGGHQAKGRRLDRRARSKRLAGRYGPEVKARFVDRIRYHGRFNQASEECGISYSTACHWKNPMSPQYDPEFAERFHEARELYRDRLEAEVERRAVHGVLQPVYRGGRKVGSVRVYSDRLLELLLKRHRREFRDGSARVETPPLPTSGPRGLSSELRAMIDDLSPEGRRALRIVLREWAQGPAKRAEMGDPGPSNGVG